MIDGTLIGTLNLVDSGRFRRGEITKEQAAAIAAANTASERASFAAQHAAGLAAVSRNRAWVASFKDKA